MKRSRALGLMYYAMALAATTEDFNIVEQGDDGTGKKPEPCKGKEPIPFKKQQGVLKMIEDYNLIKSGKSKKGITKQTRIKNKIDEWLKSGVLKENDLIQKTENNE